MTMNGRTRRVVRILMAASSSTCLAGAGLAGLWFHDHPMDMVLVQLVFYGAWLCLLGAFAGGTVGAAVEEDACGELDMGTMSSMGGILGTLSAGLLGTALTGLAFFVPWQALWVGAVGVELAQLALRRLVPARVVRGSHLDARGCLCDADGRRLPEDQQPLRMRDRMAILLAVGAGVMLALTLTMARMMGSDLGSPVMMAPMMYGMFGTMLGGMLGGWLAGLLDEHRGSAEHDNPVMVSAMALMAGMMGGMPSGMIGGMMAVMGTRAIGVTVATGVALALVVWLFTLRGRYQLAFGPAPADEPVATLGPSAATVGGATLRVGGMSCLACVEKVQRSVGRLPGVTMVSVDLAKGVVDLRWSADFSGIATVQRAIEDVGYDAGSR